jgi:cytochrome c oxidase cbb3-type subunit 2
MTRVWLLMLGALATVAFATIVLVVIPGTMLVDVPRPEQLADYTPEQARGREVYVENGCVYCHSQQVRDPSFTTDMDRGWGSRPTVPADYVYDRPHLLGTMRTGPDLINVGQRLPDPDWHLIHFYDPRVVNEWSVMPPFPFLFELKDSADVRPSDRVVPVRGPRAPRGKVVVATADALALTAYMLALKRQYPVPASERATMRTLDGARGRGAAGDGRTGGGEAPATTAPAGGRGVHKMP